MVKLARIEERYRSLLRTNQNALSRSTIGDVFEGMCSSLRKLLHYDRAALALYNHDSLRIAALYGPHENSVLQIGYPLVRKSSQSEEVFDKIIRRDLAKESRSLFEKHTLNEGYRSLCSVSLVVRGNAIGEVTVVGIRQNQFSMRHAQVVQEMSNQIVLAISLITLNCAIHPNTKLLCPRCIGAAGGKTTVTRHREALSDWGKKGGRGRKRQELG